MYVYIYIYRWMVWNYQPVTIHMLSIYIHLAACSPSRHMQRSTFPGQRFPPCRSRLPAHTPMRRPAKIIRGIWDGMVMYDNVWGQVMSKYVQYLWFFHPLYTDHPFTPTFNGPTQLTGAQHLGGICCRGLGWSSSSAVMIITLITVYHDYILSDYYYDGHYYSLYCHEYVHHCIVMLTFMIVSLHIMHSAT